MTGTLNGYDVHYLNGQLANGNTPGLLSIRLTGGGVLKPGSMIHPHRIFDSRANEVGAV